MWTGQTSWATLLSVSSPNQRTPLTHRGINDRLRIRKRCCTMGRGHFAKWSGYDRNACPDGDRDRDEYEKAPGLDDLLVVRCPCLTRGRNG